MSSRFPSNTVPPTVSARAPMPSRLSKAVGAATVSLAARRSMAWASGCADPCSTAAAAINTASSVIPSAVTTSTTSGWPIVSVPVLSKTITLSRVASSSADAFLNRMPCFAPRPVLTMTAIGVASPSASGHAITNTVMVIVIANSSGCPMSQNQAPNVARPMAMAAITNHWAALSARSCAGALEFCAS